MWQYQDIKFMKLKMISYLLFSLFFLLPSQVSAQSIAPDLDLTIFPPTAYLTIKPGTSITHRVILKYEGAIRVKVLPELVDFTTDGLNRFANSSKTFSIRLHKITKFKQTTRCAIYS